MNLYFLDDDTKLCAQAHCDQHVIEMALGYAQMMSTTHRVLDEPSELIESMYKPTHENHPSAIWLRESDGNYKWMYQMWHYLCKDYWWRYDKIHKGWTALYNKLSHTPINIPEGQFSRPPQCMPNMFKQKDTIKAYREYYIKKYKHIAKWGAASNNRRPPKWFIQGMQNANV